MTDADFQKFMIEHMTKLAEDVQDLRQNVARMEFQLTEKINVLFDGQVAINEKLDEHTTVLIDHTKRLERIENKLETHSIQIEVLDKTKSNKRKVK